MSSARGLRQVGYFDCPGGGQIVVAGTTAFIGRMRAPAGTSIVNIAGPARPRLFARLEMPPGTRKRVQSNDVTTDDRGLFYLLDRLRGLTILERC